ncbi:MULTISPECIES: P-type conjugative transfer protein TrbJ [Sinorhizobium]|uniref:P-type conjugative transfer protein TrbJ n=1 Tax=Sinorhizobium TaxID=28105 RepID=UPI000BEA8E62|nr:MULTISPECIES: P-type conjugative transfer protein TrbJ [Sinorhizobium]PDT48351.1 P-type conjugative transfer protein TrbJ [Sinorhizobium sp. NG07B]POH29992.1 conjugal transfer protein TrbJ [Sinorhizobium americanum]
MPNGCSTWTNLLAGLLAAAATIAAALPVQAGTATGAATEWTQVLNNGELISLVGQSGEQIQNQLTQISQLAQQIETQLNIYENLLQNTATLPYHIWGDVERDLNQLRSIVDQGQSISFSMANADDLLQQRFESYANLKTDLPNAASFSSTYETWSDTNRDTIGSTLKAASLTADQFDSEESTMSSLRSMSETADGQMRALQVGHQIAAQQVAQIQKLRGLVSQQMTMMGTWLQAEQTDKDLAQARREEFFNAEVKSIPEGQKMEPRW